MEFVIFVIVVVFWKVWAYPILYLVNFLPNSFFVSDSTGEIRDVPVPKPVRKPYGDSTPDPFINLTPSTSLAANQFMSGEDKAAYLHSRKWMDMRLLVLSFNNNECKACGSKGPLEIHHITYQRLGDERTEDLTPLCGGVNGCHNKLHNIAAKLHPDNPYGRQYIYSLDIIKTLP